MRTQWILLLLAAPFSGVAGDSPPRKRIPRIIWSFWNNVTQLPKAVQLARASWAVYAPDYEVRFLDQDTWERYLPPGSLSPAGLKSSEGTNVFADWLRLHLLTLHGGVWIDSTIFLTAPLDLLVNESADLSSTFMEGNVEASFLAAPRGASVVRRWRDEIAQMSSMDESAYDAYLTSLKVKGIEPLNGHYRTCDWSDNGPVMAFLHALLHAAVACINFFVGLTWRQVHVCGERFWMHYLKINVSFNAAVGAVGRDTQQLWDKNKLSLQNSVETLSYVSVLTKWQEADTAAYLMTRQSAELDLEQVKGVKLRKKERNAMEAWEHCEEGSLVCRVQRRAGIAVFEELPTRAEL